MPETKTVSQLPKPKERDQWGSECQLSQALKLAHFFETTNRETLDAEEVMPTKSEKWGGIKSLARDLDRITVVYRGKAIEAELRRRIEPLLLKAEALAFSSPLNEPATYGDNVTEVRKELETWK